MGGCVGLVGFFWLFFVFVWFLGFVLLVWVLFCLCFAVVLLVGGGLCGVLGGGCVFSAAWVARAGNLSSWVPWG